MPIRPHLKTAPLILCLMVAGTALTWAEPAQSQDTRPSLAVEPRVPQPYPPGAQIKKNIRGFTIGMLPKEVDMKLEVCSAVKRSKGDGFLIYISEIKCALKDKDERLELKTTKGLVDGAETEIVKKVDFFFSSGAERKEVFAAVVTDFHAKPLWMGQPWTRAVWVLGEELELELQLNQEGSVGRPDLWWLTLRSGEDLPAETAWKAEQARVRATKSTPKF